MVPSKLDVACINIKVHVVLFPDIESYLVQTCTDRNKNTELLLRAIACMAGKLVVYGGQEKSRKVKQVIMEELMCMYSPTLPAVIQVCQLKQLKKNNKRLNKPPKPLMWQLQLQWHLRMAHLI